MKCSSGYGTSCLLVKSIQVADCRRRRHRRRHESDVLSTLRLTRLPSNSTLKYFFIKHKLHVYG